MDISELRVYAKEKLGVKQAMNMKENTLKKRVKEIELSKPGRGLSEKVLEEMDADLGAAISSAYEANSPLTIETTAKDDEYFKSIRFNIEWLTPIANQYNFNRFQYSHKCRAFRCYRGLNQIDWISINDLAMLNGKGKLAEHKLHYQSNKPIIKLPWRK